MTVWEILLYSFLGEFVAGVAPGVVIYFMHVKEFGWNWLWK